MRGVLTQEITDTSMRLLNVRISQEELRLMPYIQHVMMNNQRIDPNKISSDERKILSSWRGRGWVSGGAGGLSISKHFWSAINEILWLGYVLRGD